MALRTTRPGYPPAAVALIAAKLGVGREGPPAILDLAAGTGKLTRELTGLGVDVIAVEPVAEMRAQLSAAAGLLNRVETVLREHGLRPGVPVTMPEQTIVRWARVRPRP